MAKEPIKTQLRLPADLQADIVAAAGKSGRSMNAEIVHRLRASFVGYFGGDPADDEKFLDSVLHPAVGKGPARDPTELLERMVGATNALQAMMSQLKSFSPDGFDALVPKRPSPGSAAGGGKRKKK